MIVATERHSLYSVVMHPEILTKELGMRIRDRMSLAIYGQQREAIQDLRTAFRDFLVTVSPDLKHGVASHEKRQGFERALAALEESMT